jgi:uncharacterized protein YrzB (UPF0473 family)
MGMISLTLMPKESTLGASQIQGVRMSRNEGNAPFDPMTEDSERLTLLNENGEEKTCVVLRKEIFRGKNYLLAAPEEDLRSSAGHMTVYVFEYAHDVSENTVPVVIKDDAEKQDVYLHFQEMMQSLKE